MASKYEKKRMQKERKHQKALQRALMKGLQPVLESGNPDLYDYAIVDEAVVNLYGDTSKTFFTDTYKSLETKKGLLDVISSLYAERVEDWLLSYGAEKIKSINTTVQKKVSKTIADLFQDGKGATQIAKELTKTFRVFSRMESLRIARTETTAAAGRGSLEGAGAVSTMVYKYWIVNRDGKERDTHRDANTEYKRSPISLNAMFTVGSDEMLSPGTGDVPKENINCRCEIGYKRIEDL